MKRVKCKVCEKDIHIDHFAGVVNGDFYCDSILCLLTLSTTMTTLDQPKHRQRATQSMQIKKASALILALLLAGFFSVGCSTSGHYPMIDWEAGTSYTPPATVEAHAMLSAHLPRWITGTNAAAIGAAGKN